MCCTLKDSFRNSIEYVTYRQEKDEELIKAPRPLFFTSTAFVDTNDKNELTASRHELKP